MERFCKLWYFPGMEYFEGMQKKWCLWRVLIAWKKNSSNKNYMYGKIPRMKRKQGPQNARKSYADRNYFWVEGIKFCIFCSFKYFCFIFKFSCTENKLPSSLEKIACAKYWRKQIFKVEPVHLVLLQLHKLKLYL